ncbi:YjbF family lipoprotein [Marinomonas primoryensis]|nr:YjbF family lipoprotein [Marinomonas primoryensis]
MDAKKGNEITAEYITALPYASSLVTINDAKPLLLILALAEKNIVNGSYQLTWITADRGAIVTENGRIIHTTGFLSNNLEELLTVNNNLPFLGVKNSWQAIYDWSPGYRYNFSADIKSLSLGTETLSTQRWQQEAEHIQERVSFTSLNSELINDFWVAPETNTTKPFIVKSIQYLGPQMDRVEMLMVKPFIEPISNSSLSSNTKDSES